MKKKLNPFTKLIATIVLSLIIGVTGYYLFSNNTITLLIKDDSLKDLKSYTMVQLQFMTIIVCLIGICVLHWKEN